MSRAPLTEYQRTRLDYYTNMYDQTSRQLNYYHHLMRADRNHTIRQVDLLYQSLDDIRDNINNITNNTNNTNRTSHQYTPLYRSPELHLPMHTPETAPARTSRQRNRQRNADQRLNEAHQRQLDQVEQIEQREQRAQTPIQQNRRYFVTQDTLTPALARNLFSLFSDPVTIRPTALQIRNATRLSSFSHIVEPRNVSCPITLEPFLPTTLVTELLGCNHLFNPASISEWFERHVKCPICRHDVREYVPVTDDTNGTTTAATETATNTTDTPATDNVTTDVPDPTNLSQDLDHSISQMADTILNQLFNSTATNDTALLFTATNYIFDISLNRV